MVFIDAVLGKYSHAVSSHAVGAGGRANQKTEVVASPIFSHGSATGMFETTLAVCGPDCHIL